MNKLIELLHDDKVKKELEILYGFTKRDICAISGKLDVFHVIEDDEYLTTSLFYKNNENFSEANKINKKTVMMNNHFIVSFDLDHKKVSQLRFDPTEGKYISLKNLSITIDGKRIENYTILQYNEMDENWYDIYSLDPSILIDLKESKEVCEVIIEADIKYIEPAKLLDYENKISELRRKNVDDLSVKQLLGVIKRRVKH